MCQILININVYHLFITLMWLLCIPTLLSQTGCSQLLLLMTRSALGAYSIHLKISVKGAFNGNGKENISHLTRVNLRLSNKNKLLKQMSKD